MIDVCGGWRGDARRRRRSRPSWILAVAVLVTGVIGSAALATPVSGLLERLTPLALLVWFALVGLTARRALRREGR